MEEMVLFIEIAFSLWTGPSLARDLTLLTCESSHLIVEMKIMRV